MAENLFSLMQSNRYINGDRISNFGGEKNSYLLFDELLNG
jgi:hypothetical protein